MVHLLGFRFVQRIRDLVDTKLYIPKNDAGYDGLQPMSGGWRYDSCSMSS